MTAILGINSNHADASVCLIKNNKLTCAVEEERFNRIKHWAGFPDLSIRNILKNQNIEIDQIDFVAINSDPLSNIFPKLYFFLSKYLTGNKKFEILNRLKNKLTIKQKFINNFNLKSNLKIKYIDHHISHISSAFYASGYEEAAGLSIDGFGDFSSLVITKCSRKKIEIIHRINFPHSLGIFYEAITQLLGFPNYGDEYKVMGLACYGKPIYLDEINNNLFFKDKFFKLNLNFFKHYKNQFSYNFNGIPNQEKLFNENIFKLFDLDQNTNNEIVFEKKSNIAASVQKIFEDKLIKICKYIREQKISKNLVYAGGCAQNSSANNLLYKSKIFDKVFIPYAPGDNGGSIGAAVKTYFDINKSAPKNLKSPYLGFDYEDQEIEKILRYEKQNFKIRKYEDFNLLCDLTTELIINSKIIGWFQDKMEFGPRALGNRSIIADPRNNNIRDIINQKIKRREKFRPFAPAILYDYKNEWFNNQIENPYMSFVEDIPLIKQKSIPAVTHIDGTGRVQTVKKEQNQKFYNLIFSFYKKTGIPILLNTSFNENEPIVNNPKEALECFLRTKMDALILNNFLIMRQ